MNVECPFSEYLFSLPEVSCPYMQSPDSDDPLCEDMEVSAENGDAWCNQMVAKAVMVHKVFIGNE